MDIHLRELRVFWLPSKDRSLKWLLDYALLINSLLTDFNLNVLTILSLQRRACCTTNMPLYTCFILTSFSDFSFISTASFLQTPVHDYSHSPIRFDLFHWPLLSMLLRPPNIRRLREGNTHNVERKNKTSSYSSFVQEKERRIIKKNHTYRKTYNSIWTNISSSQ